VCDRTQSADTQYAKGYNFNKKDERDICVHLKISLFFRDHALSAHLLAILPVMRLKQMMVPLKATFLKKSF